MARKNPQKRQKADMKKRKKAKERQRRASALVVPRANNLIRKARQFPVFECLINRDWETDDSGLVRILLSRSQPNDGGILFGTYLVDMFCLGLKNTHSDANVPVGVYRQDVLPQVFMDENPAECPLDLAHQIVYQAIEYAAKFGFKPQRDFKWSQYVLDERGKWPESHQLTFGKDGKPFFVAGPFDNIKTIKAKLDKNPGPGNYDYLVPLGDPMTMFDDDYDDDEGDEGDDD
jgi:hypothetical protein